MKAVDALVPPARDEHLTFGRDDRVRITLRPHALHDAQRLRVDNRHGVTQVLGDIEKPSVARHGQPGRITRAAPLRILDRKPGLTVRRCASVPPRVSVDNVFITARYPKRLSVRRKRHSDKRGRLTNRLENASAPAVDHLDSLL